MRMMSLFLQMLKIGCIGFGGGSALIPIMHKTFVEEKKAVEESMFEEAVVISSITPGALTIKLAGEIGRQIAGWKGMLVGASAMALPGVALTVLFMSLVSNLSPVLVYWMEILSVGVMAYIVCALVNYIRKTIVDRNGKHRWIAIGIIVSVFVLTNIFRFSTLSIFVITFVIIFICYGFRKERCHSTKVNLDWSGTIKEVGIMLGVVLLVLIPTWLTSKDAIVYACNGILSSLISFGGGDAYLTVADGLFVGTGIISADKFYGTIVPLVNLLPGSILCKALSGIGYSIGGYSMALLGFACSFSASCGIVSIVGCLYRGMGELPIFYAVKQWIRPVVSGLMLNVIVTLVKQCLEIIG